MICDREPKHACVPAHHLDQKFMGGVPSSRCLKAMLKTFANIKCSDYCMSATNIRPTNKLDEQKNKFCCLFYGPLSVIVRIENLTFLSKFPPMGQRVQGIITVSPWGRCNQRLPEEPTIQFKNNPFKDYI